MTVRTAKPTLRPTARKAAVLDVIERQGRASVEDLAARFATSPETVRRDLNALADAGHVQKVHGGAVRKARSDEGPFQDRLKTNRLAKLLAAQKLAGIVSAGQSVLIDTGSTTLIAAETLAKVKDLTVITNSTRIADVFARAGNGAEVMLLGGTYIPDNAQTVGAATCAEIGRYSVDHAILTIGTLNGNGAFDYAQSEAQVARAMIGAAAQVTIVADRTKLGKTSTFQVCTLEQIDILVLDGNAPADLVGPFLDAGIDIR